MTDDENGNGAKVRRSHREICWERRAALMWLLRVDAGLAFGDDVATPVAALILSENVL